METYDVIVVGAGPGGYVAAIRCAQLGLKTACVEKWLDDNNTPVLGGTCLNTGCIPSKALLQSSDYYYKSLHHFAHHGIKVDRVQLDLDAMMQRKHEVVNKMGQGVRELFNTHGVDLYTGTATLLNPNDVQVTAADDSVTKLTGKNIILAPGSRPKEHAKLPWHDDLIIDSTTALSLERVPETLAVIGAGVIGLELGSVWQRLGSRVSLFKSGSGLLPQADPAIARQAKNLFSKQGLDFRFGTQIESSEIKSDHVLLNYSVNGQQKQEKFDKVLVAIGRVPNTDKLFAGECKIDISDSGEIVANGHCQTSIDNIYAIGDAVRGPMLAHKGSEEGIMVAEHIAGRPAQVNYDLIPFIIYTNPEIAWCGQTETQLKADDIEFRTGSFPFSANGRAHAGGEAQGLVKILADANTDRILGVHMIGPHVSELIQQAVIAMEFKASAEDLALSMFAHPTLSEAVHEAALDVQGRSIHKLKI